MTAPAPPARNLVISCLREGLGVEDIAVICECHADQVRAIAAELRSAGIMQAIRFDPPRCAA
ncbi:hypothetical protein F1642_05115 [Paracoccus sp. NBH48]|uniref:hypothetical protein n=1 Tax=Paracoccus sp. NBH48 TaxID=2596918 RepID=UPI001891D5F5|nr:hypothetical protein [Paracoccus sp. NBH48]MBF5078544.1 hypothetical protein [Paracoccus sp. NBH48]